MSNLLYDLGTEKCRFLMDIRIVSDLVLTKDLG